MTRVFVDGQEGTTGLQIRQVLAARDDIDVLSIDPDKRKDPAERARLLNAADVAFLCLPDTAAREAVAMVENPATCVIDASTAHRTAPGWVFGLPELAPDQRAADQGNPSASPTPAATPPASSCWSARWSAAASMPAAFPLTATSLTGYSGGGRKMIEQYETSGDPRLTSPRPYALGLAHKHLPEMVAHSGLTWRPSSCRSSANFYKGLAVSVPLQLSQLGRGTSARRGARNAGGATTRASPSFASCRSTIPKTIAAGGFDVQGCNDTNRVDIFVFGGDEPGAADRAARQPG